MYSFNLAKFSISTCKRVNFLSKKNEVLDRYFSYYNSLLSEAVARRCSVKKVCLEISQNSQENTCARASFLMLHASQPATLLKKEALTQVFSCELC